MLRELTVPSQNAGHGKPTWQQRPSSCVGKLECEVECCGFIAKST